MAKGLSSRAGAQMQETGHVRWGRSSWDKIPILSLNFIPFLPRRSIYSLKTEPAERKKTE